MLVGQPIGKMEIFTTTRAKNISKIHNYFCQLWICVCERERGEREREKSSQYGHTGYDITSAIRIRSTPNKSQAPYAYTNNRSLFGCNWRETVANSSEISPTRCKNCVFILRNGFTLHVSGDNLTHHQEYIFCIWPQVSRLT